jgi:hypothetical protein
MPARYALHKLWVAKNRPLSDQTKARKDMTFSYLIPTMAGLMNAGDTPRWRLSSKHTISLTISSLLSILFTLFHLTDDYVRGMSKGDLGGLTVVFVLDIWLYGTLVLPGGDGGTSSFSSRRSLSRCSLSST